MHYKYRLLFMAQSGALFVLSQSVSYVMLHILVPYSLHFYYMCVFVYVHALFSLQFVTSKAIGILIATQIVISSWPSW